MDFLWYFMTFYLPQITKQNGDSWNVNFDCWNEHSTNVFGVCADNACVCRNRRFMAGQGKTIPEEKAVAHPCVRV